MEICIFSDFPDLYALGLFIFSHVPGIDVLTNPSPEISYQTNNGNSLNILRLFIAIGKCEHIVLGLISIYF